MRIVTLAACALLAAACSNSKNSGDQQGLPPATDWASAGEGEARPQGGDNPHANPHANPHGAMGDPHAGLDMGGGGGVEDLGLPPPDPNRPVDPDKHLRGIITADDAAKEHIKPGAVLFLSVRRAGDDGKASGAPIAVDRLVVNTLPMPFELTGAHAMIGGTAFDGDVVVSARVDQDGDAISKQPGDVEGTLAASIPNDSLVLKLDTVRE